MAADLQDPRLLPSVPPRWDILAAMKMEAAINAPGSSPAKSKFLSILSLHTPARRVLGRERRSLAQYPLEGLSKSASAR
jgi:hypothetical protein